MNRDIAEGKFDQMKGKVKQSVGEAVGNDKLANSGVVDQVKGAARETWGDTKDAAAARSQSSARDVREKIVSTAQNVKSAVSPKRDKKKPDDVKYKRTA